MRGKIMEMWVMKWLWSLKRNSANQVQIRDALRPLKKDTNPSLLPTPLYN